ncbi:MAG: N-acetyltransferase [Clostridiales bacterium]|nr:N-acetyltransferase [Clostridiales bacterium]
MEILFYKDRFYIGDNPRTPQAAIRFRTVADDQIEVISTYTNPSLRGQGIARKLVEKVVDYARENKLKISSTCSYAQKVLAHDAYEDVYTQ